MKKLLITGFDPFGGEQINPSWESVKLLEDKIGEYSLIKLQIPTIFKKGVDKIIERANEINPDVIICVGQAGGRRGITPEVVAINLVEANIPDNEGNQPMGVPVINGGENAYFSTLPIRQMVTAIKTKEIPSALSFSAGAFVCNEVLYTLLNYFNGTNVKVGFIHVPFLPEQAGDKYPSMELNKIVEGLTIAIEQL